MRLSRSLIAAALCAVALVGVAAPAEAAPGKDHFAVGDSVMLGAAEELRSLGFAVDATESRQAYKGPALIRQRAARLPANVIVHLGTNGTFPLETCRRIVKLAGPERRVFFVNISVPRSWEKGNNKVLAACDASFPADRVHVIDWKSAVAAHPRWLYSDHIHLNAAGQQGFARLIDGTVDDVVARARAQALENASGTGKADTLG